MKKIFLICTVLCLLAFCACSHTPGSETLAETSIAPTTESPTVTVTIPEGYTAVQIAQKLEESGVCSAADFMTQVNSPEKFSGKYRFLQGFRAENKAFALEGYIFPDTYEFYRGESAEAALSRFLKNTDAKLTDEHYKRAGELGYTMDEIITLASVVQSESGYPNENAKVASVVHNRINSPDYGKLQCDVTINYVNNYVTDSPYLEGDTEKYKDLYNTYKCTGLPAGAICNPGIQCIEAALYPADTDYFFFVTDKDWNYYYASTYEEHLENCKLCNIGQ